MENVVGNPLKWKTSLEYPSFASAIRYQTPLLALGSCFAENIGGWLRQLAYPIVVNPFGTTFNPLSIANSLDWLLSEDDFGAEHLLEYRSLWHSFYHHSHFSGETKESTLQTMQTALQAARNHLQRASWGILTLGTAWVFALHDQPDFVVNNCHQLPASRFERRRLSVETIVEALETRLLRWRAQQPALRIVLTVSPIRHLKDGLVENQLSKATLLLAVHELCQRHDFIHYFPAYEILLDDLRDYRYYADDLVHPSEEAVRYIAQWFERIALAPEEYPIRKAVYQIRQAEQHRPLHPQSAAHQQFLQQVQQKKDTLLQQYPWLVL